MPREILAVKREGDDSFGFYEDGELIEKYQPDFDSEEVWGILIVKTLRHLKNIADKRLKEVKGGMTSGYMKCPKCGKDFQYADWLNGVWVENCEPWKCQNCHALIITDKEKGYGLKVVPNQEGMR